MRYVTHFLVLCLGALSACQSEDAPPSVDDLLAEYIDRFYQEAAARSVTIVDDGALSAYLISLTDEEVLGQCVTYSDGTQAIRIDETYWSTISDLDKEYIVFHELGHCLLHRDHNNTLAFGRQCASIMQSGDGVCQVRYTEATREALIDELFLNQ